MANTPEIGGQDSGTDKVNVISLAAELDAPDDENADVGGAENEVKNDAAETKVEAAAADVVPETPAAAEGDGDKTPAVEGAKEPDAPAPEPTAEQLQMIQLIRQMRKELSLSNAKQQRQEEELRRLRQNITKPKDEFDDDDLLGNKPAPATGKPENDPVPLSELEQLQNELSVIGQQRSEHLVTIVETMAVNPKFEDVKEVCSRSNLNDLIDAMATKVATDQGIDPVVAALKIENAIWRQPNPYLWMYETIKSNHPKYAKPSQPKADEAKPAEAAPRTPKPAEAPPSVMPLGPTDTAQGTGWTAAKLDAMDEMELVKVPANIRQQYLSGQLQ